MANYSTSIELEAEDNHKVKVEFRYSTNSKSVIQMMWYNGGKRISIGFFTRRNTFEFIQALRDVKNIGKSEHVMGGGLNSLSTMTLQKEAKGWIRICCDHPKITTRMRIENVLRLSEFLEDHIPT